MRWCLQQVVCSLHRARHVVERRAAPPVQGAVLGAGVLEQEDHDGQQTLGGGEVQRRAVVVVAAVDVSALGQQLPQRLLGSRGSGVGGQGSRCQGSGGKAGAGSGSGLELWVWIWAGVGE